MQLPVLRGRLAEVQVELTVSERIARIELNDRPLGRAAPGVEEHNRIGRSAAPGVSWVLGAFERERTSQVQGATAREA